MKKTNIAAVVFALHLLKASVFALAIDAHLRRLMSDDVIAGPGDPQEVMGEVIQQHFSGCHLLVLQERESALFTSFLGILESRHLPLMIADPWTISLRNDSQKEGFLEEFLIGDQRIGCRAVIVYLPEIPDSSSISILSEVRIWEQPYIKVLAIGFQGGEEYFLLHHTFRNTIHSLYFAFVSKRLGGMTNSVEENDLMDINNHMGIKAYLRCLYCDGGNSQVILLDTWYQQTSWVYKRYLFPDQFKDFYGYKLRMVVKSFFPFAEYTPDSNEAGTTVTFVDCLELRMLREMAKKLNLTFEARLSIDDEWGQPIGNGIWTGIVGTLMREDADFGTCLFPSAKRNAVLDFTRMYAPEPFLIITLKPRPLPQYLALIKPFTVLMWIAVGVTVVIVGTLFWILQRGWREVFSLTILLRQMSLMEGMGSEPERFNVSEALLYTWGILFQQRPFQHPTYAYGRLWVACWVIFSLLILMTYKSALIASLSVPEMSEAVDTLQQLLEKRGWTWGMEPHYSVGWRWLMESDIPDNQRIAKTLEVEDITDQMRKVSKGRHAFFSWKNYVKSFIAAEYTDQNGYTPIHISRQSYLETSGSYWGCRKGAPFLRTIVNIKQQLFQGSILELWLNQIFRETAKNARKRKGAAVYVQPEGKQVVLSLQHLQGAFYLLFLGQGLAVLSLAVEYLQHRGPEFKSSTPTDAPKRTDLE